MRTLPYLFVLLAMGFVAPALAEMPLEDWRIELNRVRSLAENDIPYAYREAQRLQAAMPAAASAADQVRMLNLLSRIEVYLGDTQHAEAHAQEASTLAKKNNDRIGLVEADLDVALNAVNQSRFDVMSEAVKDAMQKVEGLDRPDLLGEAMLRTSMMYRRFGRMDDSVEVALKAQEIAKRSRNAFAQAFAYQGVAIAYSLSTRGADAREYYQLMRNAAQEAHSRLLEGDALIGLGSALTGMGDTRSGERLIREGLALYRKAGGPFYIAHAQHALAENMRQQGRYAEAQKALDESIAIYQSRSNRVGLWWSLNLRGEMYRQRGDIARSDADAEQAYKLAREIGHPYYLSESARMLAARVAGHGDYKRAYTLFTEAAEMQARNASETTSARMLDLAKRFEEEASKREIEELTRRNELQTVQHYWLWTVLVASLTLLVLTALFMLRLRRSSEEIRALNIGLEHRVAERTEALQRSQQSLAEAQRIARLGSWELDIPGNALFWSEEVYRIFETDPQQFTGTYDAFLDAVHPEDRLNVEQTYRVSLQEKRPYEIEHRILFRDGRVKYVQERCETIFDGGGRPLRSIGTVQDITERKEAEQKLKESLEFTEGVINAIPDILFEVNREGRYLNVWTQNPELLAAQRAQLLGKTVAEVLSPENATAAMRAIREADEQGASRIEDLCIELPIGKRWFSHSLSKKPGGAPGEATFLVLSRDITERKQLEEQLATREREFRRLADNLPDNIARWDCEGRYLYVNPTHEHTLGKKAGDLVGQLIPDSHDQVWAGIKQVVATGQAIHALRQSVMVEGKEELHDVSLVPEFDADGRVIGVLGIGRDMTERYRMQEALAERERELRALAESSPGMMGSFYLKPDGTVCMPYVSPNIHELFGLRPEEIVEDAAPLMRLNHPDDAQRVMDSIAESARTMSPWRCEYRIIHPTKGERWMEGHTSPYPHPKGGTIWYGYVHDITERKRMEAALAVREQEFRALAENSPDTIARYIQGGIRTYINPLFAKLAGKPAHEMLGVTAADYRATPEALAYHNALLHSLESGEEGECEYTWPAFDGRLITSHIRIVPEFDADGKVTSVLAVGRDITARKQLEAALQASEARYRQNFDMLQSMLESSSGVSVFALDKNYRYLAFNKRHRERVKFLRNTDIEVGMDMLASLENETFREFCRKGFDLVLSGQSVAVESREEVVRDGVRVVEYNENYGSPIIDEHGEIVGITVFAVSINARKEAELKLKEALEFSEGIINALPDILFELDGEGRYLNVWTHSPELLAAQKESLLGRTVQEVLAPDSAATVMEALREAAELDASFGKAIRIDLPQGESWFELSVSKKPGAQSFLVLSRDITARRQVESALSESEARLRALIDNLPFEFWAMDNSLRYIMQNAVSLNHYGNVVGKRIEDLGLPSEVVERWLAQDRDVLAGKILHEEYAREVDGELRYFESYTAPVVLCDTVIGIVGASIDITARKRMEEALREREAFLDTLLNAIPIPVFYKDTDGIYLGVNRAYETFFGVSPAQLVGKSVFETHPKALAEIYHAKDNEVFESSSAMQQYESQIQHKNGTLRDVFFSKAAFFDEQGRVKGLVGAILDITERKQMEVALKTSELLARSRSNLLRAILESSPQVIVFALDTGYRYQAFNSGHREAMRAIWGKEIEMGMNMLDVISLPLDRETAQRAFDRALSGESFVEENAYGDETLKREYWQSYYSPIRSESGEITGLTCFVLNISARKRLEAELLASRNFLNSVLDAVPDPVFVKDRQHNWVMLNDAFCRFIGHPAPRLLGKSDYDFFPKEEADVFWEKDEVVFDSDEVNLNEEDFTSADGVTHFIQTKKTPFISAAGEQMLVGVIRDITERKQFEIAREMALTEAQRLAKLRSDFIAHMSHELRTPLNGILGYAQMLGRDGKLGKKQIASVDVIRHSGEHLLSLIEDILDLARIESGKLELHQSDIPLRHFLQVIERMIAIRAREKNLECVGEYAADLPTGIRGDEKRLRQVLLNLLSNAVKFTERGKVVLNVSRVAPSRLAFAVSDTGIGIAASEQEHLFQPFGQVGDAQQRAEGTGLGLAISRQLVRLMGGDITLESHPGDGSTFRFELELPEVEVQPESGVPSGKAVRGRKAEAAESVLPMVAPPEAEMRELHRLALLGNMRDIINQTAQIGSLDQRYRPFADHLKRLAEGYQSKAILAFVEEYLK